MSPHLCVHQKNKVMETLSKALLSIHIIAGSISLILFWIPIFAKKGGKLHNTVGKIYVYLMWIVVISAGILSIENVMQGNYLMAAFLGFLTLITSNPLWYGMAALKQKKGMTEGYKRIHLIFNSVITVCGFLLIIYGLTMIGEGPEIMLFFFGILGMTSSKEVYNHFKHPKTKEDWYKQHYSGMVTTAIAAYTAFAVFGGNQLLAGKLSGYLMALPWILPTIIGTGILVYMGKSRKKKAVPTAILILFSISLFSQVYVEKQTRHRFAQMNMGLDYQTSMGGETTFLNSNEVKETLTLSALHKPRFVIGGTHFWGHADFYLAIPLYYPSMQEEGQVINFGSGVETVFKYYPSRIEHQKIRPFVGVSIAPFYFEQDQQNQEFGNGPSRMHTSVPLLTGFTYNYRNHLLELGVLWNYNNQLDYYIGRAEQATIKTPPLYLSFSYRYMFDTTIGAEEAWESGRTAEITEKLASGKQLNSFFIGLGMSSAFWMGASSYNTEQRPYVPKGSASIMGDFSVGYYWHQPDVNVVAHYRSYQKGTRTYGAIQSQKRQSWGIEATKHVGDYHGFAPFIGPVITYENLSFKESFERELTQDISDQRIGYGITFGWDIRPDRRQAFLLRTNLRWFPNLQLAVAEDQKMSFNNIEFNFIQLLLFPSRLF